MRLAGVLDHDEIVPTRDLENRVHVRHEPVQVHRDDRARPRRNGFLEAAGSMLKVSRVDVDEHGLGAGIFDGGDGRDERERDGDDFVAGADSAASNERCSALVPVLTPIPCLAPE